MNAHLIRPHDGWNFTIAHQALLSKISKESGLASRLEPPVDRTGDKAGFVVSLLAHLVLVAIFTLGLNWKTEEPAAFEAILWSEIIPSSEPTATKQTKVQPVEKQAKRQPTVEPTPPKQIASRKADIQLQKKEIKPEPKKKPEPKIPETKKTESKPKPESKPEPKPEPKETEPALNTELATKLRQEELARIMGGAPNIGSSSAGTSRNKAQYSDKIRQYVRSKLVFPGADAVSGNPEAIFEVKQLPTGEIVSITQKKSSGLPAWDSAVERALQRSNPLPKAEDGSVEPVLVLSFRPKDV